MSAVIGRDPVDGYVWLYSPSVVTSSGPERVVRDDPAPEHRPRPVGFAPAPRHRRPGPALDLEPSKPGRRRADGCLCGSGRLAGRGGCGVCR